MEKEHRAIAIRNPRWLILVLVTFAIGVGSGLGGMALALLLRLVQHIAYGHGLHTIVGKVSFLQEVTAASALRGVFRAGSGGAVGGPRLGCALRCGQTCHSERLLYAFWGHADTCDSADRDCWTGFAARPGGRTPGTGR